MHSEGGLFPDWSVTYICAHHSWMIVLMVPVSRWTLSAGWRTFRVRVCVCIYFDSLMSQIYAVYASRSFIRIICKFFAENFSFAEKIKTSFRLSYFLISLRAKKNRKGDRLAGRMCVSHKWCKTGRKNGSVRLLGERRGRRKKRENNIKSRLWREPMHSCIQRLPRKPENRAPSKMHWKRHEKRMKMETWFQFFSRMSYFRSINLMVCLFILPLFIFHRVPFRRKGVVGLPFADAPNANACTTFGNIVDVVEEVKFIPTDGWNGISSVAYTFICIHLIRRHT